MLIYGSNAVWAEKPSGDFPKTEREIVEILQPKGFRPPEKGPQDIVRDTEYAALIAEYPKARALILFDFDSDVIKPESYPLLREYANALTGELKEAMLIVAGHTDSTGSDAYNLKLSLRRAEAVKLFLVSAYQIDPARLFVQGYGERQPIESNETEQGRALNRRVEFIRIQ